METWKDIKDYEGFYQISNNGRVKSLNYNKTKQPRIMSLNNHKRDYKHIILCKNGEHKAHQVHRLVAQAFIPNPNNYPCVNHKDQDPSNNNVTNLEWCTHRYNNIYGTAIQKRIEKMKGKKLTEEHKMKISKNSPRLSGGEHPQAREIYCLTTNEYFQCIKDAAIKYNICPSDIGKCCRGKQNAAGKHPITGDRLKWKFINTNENK